MALKVNLLKKSAKKKRKYKLVVKRSVINSSLVTLIIVLVLAVSVYAYQLILTKELEVLEGNIVAQEQIVASYKDIEERKSLLTVKTNEISDLYDTRFDYLKAIEDAQQLFGFSIAIETISIEKEGVVDVTARKVGDITLSQEQAFSTNIKELNLTLIVPTSTDLELTIDTLLGFEGQGLSKVVVSSTQLLDSGEYEVGFAIEFSANQADVEQVDTEQNES